MDRAGMLCDIICRREASEALAVRTTLRAKTIGHVITKRSLTFTFDALPSALV
jgi:hypothetical protein